MKPDAALINTSQGEVVDERALTLALQEGRLRGAGLDVFARERLPADSPLLCMQQVVLTPHSQPGRCRRWRSGRAQFAKVLRVLRGEPPINRVA